MQFLRYLCPRSLTRKELVHVMRKLTNLSNSTSFQVCWSKLAFKRASKLPHSSTQPFISGFPCLQFQSGSIAGLPAGPYESAKIDEFLTNLKLYYRQIVEEAERKKAGNVSNYFIYNEKVQFLCPNLREERACVCENVFLLRPQSKLQFSSTELLYEL